MGMMAKRLVVGVTSVAVGLVGMASGGASAETSTSAATIVQANPESSCAGEAATLSWAPPAGVGDLTGYHILHQHYSRPTPSLVTTEVGRQQNSFDFTIPFGLSVFLIRAVTSAGLQSEPFASASVRGNRAPSPLVWDNRQNDAVGHGTATVSYAWSGPVTESTTGGTLPVTVRITALPGGASVEIPIGDAIDRDEHVHRPHQRRRVHVQRGDVQRVWGQ